ncbi:MAG: Rv1355c family protein [Pseudomonadota bacterium]
MSVNISHLRSRQSRVTQPATMSSRAADNQAYRPLIFDPIDPDDVRKLDELLSSERVWQVDDTLEAQLWDLAKSRFPRHKKLADPTELLGREIAAVIEPLDIEAFGRWVFYPWSGRLLRLLPPTEFRELRLDRNRNKLTRDEQTRLSRQCIGIVGLSVGNAIARAIALEGTCGRLKLADHDHLELSNLNRIQAGVEHLGLSKPVIAARQIAELDPYLRVEVLVDGLTETNLATFLDEPRLDLLIEECDDLRLKVSLREAARARRIPVIMETSDRGMLDVERFDLEATRPILHGLLGDVRSTDIPAKLTQDDKVKFALPFLGAETLSARMAASMLEIEETISSWPQLGGDVLLGGATVAAAVRHYGLGQSLPSGRRWVDLHALIDDRDSPSMSPSRNDSSSTGPSPPVDKFIEQAIQSPSGGNSQPWQFSRADRHVQITVNEARAANSFDGQRKGAVLALGAAAESMNIAAAADGWQCDWSVAGEVASEFRARTAFAARPVGSTDAQSLRLLPALKARRTSRANHRGKEVSQSTLRRFTELALDYGVQLHWLETANNLSAQAEIGELLGESDRIRLLCPTLHREMFAELRWSSDECIERKDGLPVDSLGMTPAERAGLGLLRRPDVVAHLREEDGALRLREIAQRHARSAAAFGLLSVASHRLVDAFHGGRAMQRLWLEATADDIGWHPMTAMIYMFDLAQRDDDGVLTSRERERLARLHRRFDALFPTAVSLNHLMLFRLCDIEAPATAAPRLSPELVTSDAPTENCLGEMDR